MLFLFKIYISAWIIQARIKDPVAINLTSEIMRDKVLTNGKDQQQEGTRRINPCECLQFESRNSPDNIQVSLTVNRKHGKPKGQKYGPTAGTLSEDAVHVFKWISGLWGEGSHQEEWTMLRYKTYLA